MNNTDAFQPHFDAIRDLLGPYKGNRVVDALPGALLFVIQAHSAIGAKDEAFRAKLLRDLDSVTAMIGKVGEVTPTEVFEQIKHHYCELQFLASALPKPNLRGEK